MVWPILCKFLGVGDVEGGVERQYHPSKTSSDPKRGAGYSIQIKFCLLQPMWYCCNASKQRAEYFIFKCKNHQSKAILGICTTSVCIFIKRNFSPYNLKVYLESGINKLRSQVSSFKQIKNISFSLFLSKVYYQTLVNI